MLYIYVVIYLIPLNTPRRLWMPLNLVPNPSATLCSLIFDKDRKSGLIITTQLFDSIVIIYRCSYEFSFAPKSMAPAINVKFWKCFYRVGFGKFFVATKMAQGVISKHNATNLPTIFLTLKL